MIEWRGACPGCHVRQLSNTQQCKYQALHNINHGSVVSQSVPKPTCAFYDSPLPSLNDGKLQLQPLFFRLNITQRSHEPFAIEVLYDWLWLGKPG
jgi:hypothetical protein